MSKDVETTVNVLSQTVSAWAEKVTRLGGRLDDLEASVGRLRAWADAHEDEREAVIRANAAKPSPMDERRKVVEEREIWTRLGDQLAALGLPTFRRVEKERDEAQKRLAEVTANLAATQAEAERLKELLAETRAAMPLEEVNKGALMVEVKELKKRLATTQEEFRRVEEERNQAWYGANRAAAEATAKYEQALRDAADGRLELRKVEEERDRVKELAVQLRHEVDRVWGKARDVEGAHAQALRDAAETKKLLEDARREVQAHAKDRSEALNKVESLTRELKAAVAVGNATSKRLNERAAAHDEALREVAVLERHLAKAREDRESEREVNEQLKKQIEDLQVALVKAREDLAEARKGTPGVQDQFRLEKLGRLFDSLFAHEADLTDETWEFWLSLETAGWLRPSRAQRFHSDMVERIQYLENAAGDQRERVRELMQQAAEASEQARLARIAEDTQRVEKEKALDRVQYLEKALANLSTAHEGLLADKEKALADKEHAVCPHCHKCATCGTA